MGQGQGDCNKSHEESEEHAAIRLQLEAMGFDVRGRAQQAAEENPIAGFPWAKQLDCIDLLGIEISSPDDLTKENKYSLSYKEKELFGQLPAWHRAIFKNFPGEWEVTKQLFPDEPNRKKHNYCINQWLIKCSLNKVLIGDDIAKYIWDRSENCRLFEVVTASMDIHEVCAMVFPLGAYSEISYWFEEDAVRYFSNRKITIDELEKAIGSSLFLGDIGVLVAGVWRRYLTDKQEYVDLYRESVNRAVFGGQPSTLSPPTKPILKGNVNAQKLQILKEIRIQKLNAMDINLKEFEAKFLVDYKDMTRRMFMNAWWKLSGEGKVRSDRATV